MKIEEKTKTREKKAFDKDFLILLYITLMLLAFVSGMNGFLSTHKVAIDKDGRTYPKLIEQSPPAKNKYP